MAHAVAFSTIACPADRDRSGSRGSRDGNLRGAGRSAISQLTAARRVRRGYNSPMPPSLLEQLFVLFGDGACEAPMPDANQLRRRRECLPNRPVSRVRHASHHPIAQSLPDPLTDETVAATIVKNLQEQCPAEGPVVRHVSRQHGDHADSVPLQLSGSARPRELACRVIQSPLAGVSDRVFRDLVRRWAPRPSCSPRW